jgi:hypothetical protein
VNTKKGLMVLHNHLRDIGNGQYNFSIHSLSAYVGTLESSQRRKTTPPSRPENAGVKQRVFNPGDLVVVRKQVQINKSKGISAKLVSEAKGLYYRELRQANPESYWLQKLSFL